MSLTEINLREKNFHNDLQSKKKSRFENIFYKALHNMFEDFKFSILGVLDAGKILTFIGILFFLQYQMTNSE